MSENQLGKDLKLIDKEIGVDLIPEINGDLATIDEDYNLGQAIINRLRTRQGELADLGHSLYGSRLQELIGELNNENTRDLAVIYAREAIQQDPRVGEILDVQVNPVKGQPNQIIISISIIPRGGENMLDIEFPMDLEVA